MTEREKIIHLWFEMWLCQQDLGIDDIFTEDVEYTESWGTKYTDRRTVKHWFDEWKGSRMGYKAVFSQRKPDGCGMVFQK